MRCTSPGAVGTYGGLRALTNVHLLVISGVQFRALIRQHAEIAENVARHLVTKLEIS